MELWRTVGTGLVGEDGFVRVVDPAWYADHLTRWFDNAEGAVPFLAAGMGDLFVWKEPVIRHVLYRSAEVRGIAPEFDSWWGLLEDGSYLDVHLDRGDYPEGARSNAGRRCGAWTRTGPKSWTPSSRVRSG